MAYSTSNPPVLGVQPIASFRRWMYDSTHTQAEVIATGFFTNARDLGMKVGDELLSKGSTTYILSAHAVIAVSATGANLSSGSLHSS